MSDSFAESELESGNEGVGFYCGGMREGETHSGRTLSLNLHFPSVIAEIYSHKVHTDAADIIIKKGWANKANMHCFKGERENA